MYCSVRFCWCGVNRDTMTVAIIFVRYIVIHTYLRLFSRKKKLDAIIIETTGLADPAPVAQTFFVDEDIKEGAR